MPDKRYKVMTVFGTRPEAIKMAPIIRALDQRSDQFEQVICATAQHREMLDQVLSLFDITPDYDLNVMRPEQSLYQVTIALLDTLEEVLKTELPNLVLVQGDTTSTFVGALAAYYQRIPVGHVEAGLRSGNKYSPFPEEINRTLTGHIADLHFAPTPAACDALLAEGIQADRVFVTGNTVIDTLLYVLERHPQPFMLPSLPPEAQVILVTAHRRESFGAPLRSICAALVELATHYPDVHLVYPVHPNPNVQRTVQVTLRGFSNIHLIKPLEYAAFCALMRRTTLILTDSGGVQEEAPTLGKPVLVMRDVTERQEGIVAGTARLVGTDQERIVTETHRLLDDPIAYAKMANAVNPYGDGRAAERIIMAIEDWQNTSKSYVEPLMGTILMVTRPIVPPWNEGSKNMAWQITTRAVRHHYHLMTTQSVDQPPASDYATWNYIYTSSSLAFAQKIRLFWHLIADDFEVVIYHFFFVPTVFTSYLLAPIMRMKGKYSVQSVPSLYKSDLSSKQAQTLFFADKVVAISDWTANKLQSLGLENVVRINAGIDLEIFKPTANQNALRKKFGLPLDVPLVLFSGELSRLDSTAIMLAIIRRVVDEDAKIHFVFACPIRKPADTTVRQEVQQKIHGWGLSDSVSFVGEVENFSSLLNACDMLAYPVARMTGKIDTPLTILEAMSTEMPIILTDLPPLNEVLQAPAGIVVPVGNEKAFAHAIIELSNDENLRREMGQIGREVVEAHYNLAAMAQAYEDLYDELT